MIGTLIDMKSPIEKFQHLLRELFQFDCVDLDFGIYRIINHKRSTIEKFIQKTLPNTVTAELDQEYQLKVQASEKLEEVARRVRATIGPDAIGSDMELRENVRDTTIGKEYQQAKQQAADIGNRASTEAEIYNHLYAFFRRYYQDGDFISKRRSSKTPRYAIPYNGEEVYLHWANSDQYYIKTAEHFHDYDWKAPGNMTVRFEIRKADVEQNNVKGDRRFFFPLAGKMQWDADAQKVIIPFEYRPPTTQEAAKYGKRNQQDKIISIAVDDISDQLPNLSASLADALLSERHRNGNGPVSHLEHHLWQYTRRNTYDFFIHKDLKGFLSRELDFYLKNEVLRLDEMERAGEQNADGWFQKMRLIKSIGNSIIDFLDQIERFQKSLWEKRKFVTETNYCIAVGSIATKFHAVIAANDPQWFEWENVFGINEDNTAALFSNTNQNVIDQRIALLQTRPTLVVDTKHFEQEFVDNLLASFDNLDGMTDGLLIHSENWQALNLLLETYSEDVKCIYIDPPYNTDASAIVYKNGYKNSSWLSLMENRLSLSIGILEADGIMCVAIDDVEHASLDKLLKKTFGHESNLGTAVVRSNPAGRSTPTGFSSSHEYAMFFGKTYDAKVGKLQRTQKQVNRYGKEDELGRYEEVTFRKHGGESAYRERRPRLFYPLFVDAANNIRVPNATWNSSSEEWQIDDAQKKGEMVVWPINSTGEEKRWKWGIATARNKLSELFVKPNKTGEIDIYMKSRMKAGTLPRTWWDDKKYSTAEHGTALLSKLFGNARGFSFPKSAKLIEDCILTSDSDSESCILDYFAGSGTTGHAVINLNREDGGRRKFILVEMGEYFDTVLLPRIKKIIYTPEWKDGKPQRMANPKEAEHGPRIVKYIRLESYEDALNNIEFGHVEQLTLDDKYNDYLLKYMLQWETKESGTLLNVEQLADPFNYRLYLHADGETRIKTIDIPETLNYLLGLHVRSRQSYDDGDKHYLVYQGSTRDATSKMVVVIWRETVGWKKKDFEQDKAFVEKHDLVAKADRGLRQR